MAFPCRDTKFREMKKTMNYNHDSIETNAVFRPLAATLSGFHLNVSRTNVRDIALVADE